LGVARSKALNVERPPDGKPRPDPCVCRFDWYPSPKVPLTGNLLIQLNGEPFEIEQPLSVTDLLARLAIDSRRVAVEHNLVIVKRHSFNDTVVRDGDTVEIVNFVGGG
jgi:sulfur carrier protein